MEYVASLSYGKDSIAMLEIIYKNKLPLDRIVHAEIWATDTVPADLPEMVKFKKKADDFILDRYGIKVEHIGSKKTYNDYFYQKFKRGKNKGRIYGFPYRMGAWCNSRLKMSVLNKFNKKRYRQYIGIAYDETKRYKVITGNKNSPLIDYKITERQCYDWCKSMDMLSPIYKHTLRGGCWFCHNQRVEELRHLRNNYPQYWKLMLKWDKDSPVTFKANGQTIDDFEKRFAEENK